MTPIILGFIVLAVICLLSYLFVRNPPQK